MDPPLQLMLVARPPRGSSVESTVQEKALSASSSRPGGAPRTLVGSMEMVLPLMRSFTSATTGSVKFGGVDEYSVGNRAVVNAHTFQANDMNCKCEATPTFSPTSRWWHWPPGMGLPGNLLFTPLIDAAAWAPRSLGHWGRARTCGRMGTCQRRRAWRRRVGGRRYANFW